MIVDAVRRATGVPVPDLGSPPPPYAPSVLVIVLGVLAIAAIIWFVVVSLRAGRLADRGISPLRAGLVSLLAMVVTIGVTALVSVHEQDANARATKDYRVATDTAEPQVVDSLEAYYGITVPEPDRVPLHEIVIPYSIDIESADGTRSCWIATVDGVYDIRCGGGTYDQSEPLRPAHG